MKRHAGLCTLFAACIAASAQAPASAGIGRDGLGRTEGGRSAAYLFWGLFWGRF